MKKYITLLGQVEDEMMSWARHPPETEEYERELKRCAGKYGIAAYALQRQLPVAREQLGDWMSDYDKGYADGWNACVEALSQVAPFGIRGCCDD